MQNIPNSENNNEIDLRELFATLWAYKLFITSTCILGIALGCYKIMNTDKQFTSTAIFKLAQETPNNFSVGSDVNTLAKIAGFRASISNSILSKDAISGRVFIEKLDAKLNFHADPYFNTYNPNSVDPIWKSLIKRAIGWQKSSIDTEEAIWQNIVSMYSLNVELEETDDGSIKVVVTHVKPHRAAEIANEIMHEIISSTKNKKTTEQKEQLSYLSNILAKALSDLEISQSNLKEFALENSALPLENFATESIRLDALREQLNQTSKLHEAVAALSLILQNKTTDRNNYLALRQKFPIIDQVEFRRILGQSEVISSWSWPDKKTVEAVFDILSERKNILQSKINASQIDAERSGLAYETYARLEREAKIAEATYTVLIEAVKAQTMASGYRPDSTEVYEYASAPIVPSAPRPTLFLILGATLGLFTGVVLSLILSLKRGVYYSKNSLRTITQTWLKASVKPLLPLKNKSLGELNSILVKKPRKLLRDIAVEIHKSGATRVVLTSSRAKLKGSDVARALASYMQSDNIKISVIDFSSKAEKLNTDGEQLIVETFVISESAGQISVLRPNGDLTAMELLSQKSFIEKIQLLNSSFDLVFLCADDDDVISLLSALEGQETFHITLVRTRNTKIASLAQMRSLIPIKGLLHD